VCVYYCSTYYKAVRRESIFIGTQFVTEFSRHRSGFTEAACVMCVFVCEQEAGTEKSEKGLARESVVYWYSI